MLINKKAFTLIELLVVVLIIGILAAIALPQYNKAVAKTRVSQMLILIRNIAGARERYYLATGNFPEYFSDLDIQLPYAESRHPGLEGAARIDIKDWFILMGSADYSPYLTAYHVGEENGGFPFITWHLDRRQILCVVANYHKQNALDLCKLLGAKEASPPITSKDCGWADSHCLVF